MLSIMVGQIPGIAAAADLSAKQYYWVKLASTTTCNVAGAGEAAVGILINEPESGEAADIFALGVGYGMVNGNSVNITYGDPLKSDASGIAVKAATDKDRIIGWALDASDADGDVIRVLVAPATLSTS